ncbi:MAG: efflux transporter outer membrane subunit [Candidatus Riflebacteria bacterium]|nr:efflux transporter outer membrane subunit [Candidatus Riflebacteria bacterium]
MTRSALLACGAAALFACGCLGPGYKRPPVPVPSAYRLPTPGGASLATWHWWRVFGDKQLQELIRIALEENKDLKIAVARIDEYWARVGFTRADYLPRVDARVFRARAKASGDVAPPGLTTSDLRAAGELSWEIDLWGKLHRATDAARADLLASEANRRAVVNKLMADVASAYLELRSLDWRREIAVDTLKGRTQNTALIRKRFSGGIVAEVDVLQAEREEAKAAASIPELDRQVTQKENELSILIGRAPGPIVRGERLADRPVLPDVPAGLPAELLARRPDIVRAEQELIAQHYRVQYAKGQCFPTFSLTGAGGTQSDHLRRLLHAGTSIWSLGATLVAPVVAFKKNRRRVQIEQAKARQLAHAYESAALQAFREVNDALVAIRTYRDQRVEVERQIAASRKALRLSQMRWEGGVVNYLEVLDSQRQLFDAQLLSADILKAQLVSAVQLYKALGGGWPDVVAVEASKPGGPPLRTGPPGPPRAVPPGPEP